MTSVYTLFFESCNGLKKNSRIFSLLLDDPLNHQKSIYTLHLNRGPWILRCEELTHWKRLWYWEGLGAGGEGDDRGWDGWMASLTRWTWVSVNSGSWWWTGRPGVLQCMGSQRVGHDWATDLIYSDLIWRSIFGASFTFFFFNSYLTYITLTDILI